MKINVPTSEPENIIVTDEDFFSAFEQPKEQFAQEEPKPQPKEEIKTDTSGATDFMDTDKTHLLSKADKDGIADFFITTVTNYVDDLAGGYSGKEEKGRYMPSSESIREMKKSLSKLIPDKFRMPEWMKLAILIGLAYTPIIKKAKKDKKEILKKDDAKS